jgi:hypothetical protein
MNELGLERRLRRLEALMGGFLEDTDLATVAQQGGAFHQSTAINCLAGWVDINSMTTVLGKLPAGTTVLRVAYQTTIVWNGGVSNTISVGIPGTPGFYVGPAAVGAVGFYNITTSTPGVGPGTGYQAQPQERVEAYYVAGGAPAPTTGKTLIIVEYTYGSLSP